MAWVVMSIACGPSIVVPEGAGSDDASATAVPPGSSSGNEPDTASDEVSEGGMLPPCEPWTFDVIIDAPSDPIRDIDFREGQLAIAGMVTPSTLALLDGSYDVDLQHDLPPGSVVWDVYTDSGANGPYNVAGTTPDPDGEHEAVFFYAYVDNLGDLVHLQTYQDALTSPWEPVRLFRDASMAGFVLSGHRGHTAGTQTLSTVRVDYDGVVLWGFDHAVSPATPFGNGDPKGGADLLEGGDLVQLTADGGRPRLLRTALVGELVWDRTLDIDARPTDVRVHPDGSILVLARSDGGTHLVRLDGDANVLWERVYSEGTDSFASVLGVSLLGNAVLIAGGTRSGVGDNVTWILIVDESGEPAFTHVGEPGSPYEFHRVVYDTSFLVTASDHAWVGRVIPHPC